MIGKKLWSAVGLASLLALVSVQGQGRKRFTYEEWLGALKIPIVEDYVRDFLTEPVEFWDEMGVPAAYLHLVNNKMLDAIILEIPSGGNTKPQTHMFEELVYVARGSGSSTFQQTGKRAQTIRWQEGSLFSPPLNVRHQHHNTGGQAARLVLISSRPYMLQTVGNTDFLSSAVFSFTDRYNAEENFASLKEFKGGRDYLVNVIPDIRELELVKWELRGRNYASAGLDMVGNIMLSNFTSEYAPRSYPQAHRHRNEAIILQLSGEGYTLAWKEPGSPIKRMDWQAGSIYSPELYWYHQHFNSGDTPAQYMGITNVILMRRLGVRDGDQLEYGDEPPEVMRIWEAETSQQ